MTIDWPAAHEGRCVVCGEPVPRTGAYICRACHRPCEVDIAVGVPRRDTLVLADARSRCCRADVDVAKRITCSDSCHEKFVEEMERDFGSLKVVVDVTTGKRHVVPTRVLVEKGLRQEELAKYPEAPPL